MKRALRQIAAALERLAPASPPGADPADGPAFVWVDGTLRRAAAFRPLPLDRLVGIDAQRDSLAENSRRHARGLPAHDALLWGARGMGKSALVKAVAGAHAIALVAVAREDIAQLPRLFAALACVQRRFVIFADDLGFDGEAAAAKTLRSVLEGGVDARPDNCRLYVTSNRRHLIPRDMAENDPVNPRDAADDHLALADRFGLSLGFHACDQATYLAICRAYADTHRLPHRDADAVQWAMGRGGRSGRVAWQWTVELAGREGRTLT